MNPAQLLSHFDRISDAPDALPRLRRFILDLAVRGKLVEQDPRDEPASELLKRIQAESRLSEDAVDPLGEKEQLFKIPQSWAWIRIGAAALLKWASRPLPRITTNLELESHSIKGRLILGCGFLRRDIGAAYRQNLPKRTTFLYRCALQ